MPEVHARFSPSSAARRIHCPPSLRLEERFPDTTSVFAEEGTAGHALAEYGLKRDMGWKDPGEAPKSEYYTEELVEAVTQYRCYVLDCYNAERAAGKAPELRIEQRIEVLEEHPGECFGTADAVLLSRDTLHIADLKLGRGVEVRAEQNEQLMAYAYGAYQLYKELYDFERIRLSIVQPRIHNLSVWECTVQELLDWAEQVLKPAVAKALAGEGEYHAGSWCRFCKAKQVCRARAEQHMELAKFEFAEPALLDDTELGGILARADELKAWVEDVYTYAQTQAILHGVRYAGYKLVEGRAQRRYTDPAEVEKAALGAGYTDIYETSLIGITAMEKLMGKKAFQELLGSLVVKPKGKLTLVPASDRREEITPAQAEFTEEL